MKSKNRTLSVPIVVPFLGLLVLSGSIIAVQGRSVEEQPTVSIVDWSTQITVVGTSEITIRPNQAIIEIGIVTEDASASQAWERNAEIADAVIRALKEIGISDKIETTKYGLSVRRDRWGVEIIGYACTHNLRITVSDIDKVGKAIDAAVGAGANRVYHIKFTCPSEKVKELKRDAFRGAVKDAKEQAEMVADAFGAVVLKVVNIYLQGNNYWPMKYDLNWSAGELGAPVTPIQPGDVRITSSVTVVYEIGWLRSL